MASVRSPGIVFLAFVMAGAAECVHDSPLLPYRLASHFDAAGMPNTYISKSSFFLMYAVVIAVATLLEFGPPAFIEVIPISMINLPNKSYWLSAPHVADTFAYLKSYFAWSGCVLLALLVYTMHLVLLSNLQPHPRLPTSTIFFLLALFVGFSIVSVIMLFRRFSLPADGPKSLG